MSLPESTKTTILCFGLPAVLFDFKFAFTFHAQTEMCTCECARECDCDSFKFIKFLLSDISSYLCGRMTSQLRGAFCRNHRIQCKHLITHAVCAELNSVVLCFCFEFFLFQSDQIFGFIRNDALRIFKRYNKVRALNETTLTVSSLLFAIVFVFLARGSCDNAVRFTFKSLIR